MGSNIRTVALARVSSKAQEDEGYSLDAQLKLIRRYCKDNRLNVIAEFRISETASKTDQRDVFRQMLQYLRKNKVGHLVVEKTDRLTRNLRDAVAIDDWLEADESRRLHMVKENLVVHKNAKSDAKLMWNIYLAFAKKYTDNLREEAMKGWDEKLAQGWMPSRSPHGYKTVLENSKKIHVINEETSPLVERAFKLYIEPGQTVSTVSDELTECGLTTRRGRPLTRSMVHKMLRNPFYIGIIRFNGREYPGAHEPLISTELYNAVQDKMGERKATRKRQHDPLFKGLDARCQNCGGTITWQLQKSHYYGSCQRRRPECRLRPLVRHDYLEDLACEELRSIDKVDTNKKIFQDMKQKLDGNRDPYVGQHRVGVMKLIARQIRRSEIVEDNLYEDKISGLITEDLYQKKLEDAEIRLWQLRERLRKLELIEGKTKPREVAAQSVLELYESESKAGKRLILASLLKISLVDGRVNILNIWPNMQKVHSSVKIEL